jgi:hypothetical protein
VPSAPVPRRTPRPHRRWLMLKPGGRYDAAPSAARLCIPLGPLWGPPGSGSREVRGRQGPGGPALLGQRIRSTLRRGPTLRKAKAQRPLGDQPGRVLRPTRVSPPAPREEGGRGSREAPGAPGPGVRRAQRSLQGRAGPPARMGGGADSSPFFALFGPGIRACCREGAAMLCRTRPRACARALGLARGDRRVTAGQGLGGGPARAR